MASIISLKEVAIFVDEFNVSARMIRPRAWVKMGTEGIVLVQSDNKSYHVAIAATLNQVVGFQIREKAFNSHAFSEFIQMI
jgi:hypothetical protein